MVCILGDANVDHWGKVSAVSTVLADFAAIIPVVVIIIVILIVLVAKSGNCLTRTWADVCFVRVYNCMLLNDLLHCAISL